MVRIGISGSYGGANLGDEAILESIVKQLRAALEDVHITVFSLDPSDTVLRHRVDHAVHTVGLSHDELFAEVRQFDMMLLGGGGILFDFWVKEHIRESLLAQEAGVPVMVYAVGAGPLDDPTSRDAVRECLERAWAVTVRDVRAQRVLEKLNVRRDIRITADAALLLDPEPLSEVLLGRERTGEGGPLIGMSVREPGPAAPDIDIDHYHIQLASAADYMVDRFGARIVFLSMEPELHDLQQSHAVVSKMFRAAHATVLNADITSGQMLDLIGSLSFAVGMRLHFLLFAALQRVPFVALPYAPKVAGFLDELGMDPPPIEGLTIGRLLAYIDRMWDRQDELKRLMDREIPVLQDRARETVAMAVELAIERGATPRGGADDAGTVAEPEGATAVAQPMQR